MRRIYIMGETTYDILFKDEKPVEAKVGGSQLNTAVSLGRIGLPASFISQFGNDTVGDLSARFLKENNVDGQFLQRFEGNSRVALAFLDEENNARYTFFKATALCPYEFPTLQKNDIILFGSSFALRTDFRSEILSFLGEASVNGAIVLYDPNIRSSKLNEEDRQLVLQNMEMADIVKGSDEDFESIFGVETAVDAWSHIDNIRTKCLLYTAGKDGVFVHWKSGNLFSAVPSIRPVSTIGAGDNFNAGLIASIYQNKITSEELEMMGSDQWSALVKISTSFAQHVCMSYDNYISKEFAEQWK